MQSIFVRIYMGILLAVIVIILLVTAGSYYVNKLRISDHVKQYYSGTFKLIGEGVARHQGEKRIQWLAAIKKLSDLNIESKRLADWSFNINLLKQLQQEKFIFQVDHFLSGGKVFILVADDTSYLEVNLTDFGSSLVRISAFLMLNELGRHKNEERVQALKKLRLMFKYPIQIKAVDTLEISAVNKRSIKNGNISVVLKSSTSSNPFLLAYAPIGNSAYALELGKIPFFNWFPQYLIFFQIAFTLLLMATSSFFLVRPLEKRLKLVDKQVENIGHNKQLLIVPKQSTDAIGQLANTVNSMANRIQRLLDAQNDMVGAISHELRTPVARIRFRMAIIEDYDEPEIVEQTIGIEQDLTELEDLINEVITFSKLKRDTPNLSLETFTQNELFDPLVNSAKLINPSIIVSIATPDNSNLTGDYRYLNRAVENLLFNALKYARSQVELGYEVSENQHAIWVSDDGDGILKQDRMNVFEPFTRLDSSRTRESGGYGLGLAIVKQIMEWHDGKVEVLSNAKQGAKMKLSWPTNLCQQEQSHFDKSHENN